MKIKTWKVALFVVLLALVISGLNISPSTASAQGQQSNAKTNICKNTSLQNAAFTLDGVALNICTSFLPDTFTVAEPDNSMQVATAVGWDQFREISVMAVPFGTKLSSEDLPVAQAGMAGQYRNLLQKYRIRQGGTPQPSQPITLFGKQVVGSTSLVKIKTNSDVEKPVLITEWVVEAGKRLWIVRASQEYSQGMTAVSINALFTNFSMSSSNLVQASTLLKAYKMKPPKRKAQNQNST